MYLFELDMRLRSLTLDSDVVRSDAPRHLIGYLNCSIGGFHKAIPPGSKENIKY